MKKNTMGLKIFAVINYLFLAGVALTCLIPMINQLAISFSSSPAVASGSVFLLPVEFTLESYEYMAGKPEFFRSLGVSVLRLVIGVPLSMIVSILAAYPLSRQVSQFKARKYYIWVFIVPMMFYGGLIPTYMVVRSTGLINNMLALVLPCAINVFNIILLMNFFRSLPKELEEAATIDGAGQFATLFKVILPVSAPVIATVLLFFMINHWNAWFDGLIYMNSPTNYPLQTYLQTQVVSQDIMASIGNLREAEQLANISDRTGKAAQ
ncbi:MAG: carbohydrate ABC transporter permease, partial [Treponema sp.]|nr:carbohydrate ABC transporter permease [Treponema sp.]